VLAKACPFQVQVISVDEGGRRGHFLFMPNTIGYLLKSPCGWEEASEQSYHYDDEILGDGAEVFYLLHEFRVVEVVH
jgi:hypothetical protein